MRLLALTLVTLCGETLWAAWPEYPLNGYQITRGPGGYFAWWKLLLVWLLFLLWVRVTDWVSRDCQEFDLPFAVWVPAVFFPFIVSLLVAVLSIPMFAIGYPIGVLAVIVPSLMYVFQRNSVVEPHQKVLTPDHIRYLLSTKGLASAEKKAEHEKGAPVTFLPLSGRDEQANQASLITARQSNGYVQAKQLIANALEHRATKIMLDYAGDGVASRFQVDGVWHDSDPIEREEGDHVLAVLKTLAGRKPADRKSRQQGNFRTEYKKQKMMSQLVTQGTKTGERAILSFAGKFDDFKKLEDLGMRDKTVEQLKTLMLSENGILVFCAMAGGGLTTTLTIALKNTDRLLRDFISLEDERHKMPEIENVDPVYYDSAAGESPATKMEALLRKQPDVLVVPDLVNKESLEWICKASDGEQTVFVTIQAKEAVEALLRILMMKIPAKEFAPQVIAVLNQRLIRKLCHACKEAYEPPPALLKKLGIPVGRVQELFRQPESPEKPCEECHGIGYLGRTAIFELLIVDDLVREVLIKQPKLDILRKAARKAGCRTLQEEGLLAVINGTTSLPELMRVLKQ